jgi:2-polyprenyl-6-hydroxyphenyl methylase/3-demethylubiquinone-9 3-methyltransferase
MQADSVNADEVKKFGALAARWWDSLGPMRPLHMMNPVRAGWILGHIAKHFGMLPPSPHPVMPAKAGIHDFSAAPALETALHILDVGCGAGLLSESLAKAGHNVLGLDASAEAIAAAQAHASGRNLPLAYRTGAAEDLLAEGQKFPVITALEIIEHVPDPAGFVATLASLLEPGGLLFISTLNRTPRAWLTAKLGAEFLLRMLPVGTHDWRQFVTPAELDDDCRRAGLRLSAIAGMTLDPLRARFRLTRDTGINYIAMAEAPNLPTDN